MARRVNSSHVCQIAKSVVLQVKDVSENRLLKPVSREVSRIRRKAKNNSTEKHVRKECTQESSKKSDPVDNSSSKVIVLHEDSKKQGKFQKSSGNNDIAPNNLYDYFRKLYDEEENRTLCSHLQPNNIKPFGSTDSSFTPTVFKRRSYSADCQYFSKSASEKVGCRTGNKLYSSPSNYLDLTTNNQKIENSILDDLLKKEDAAKTLDNRIFSAPEPVSSKYSEGDSTRFISSFAERSVQAKFSNNKLLDKITDNVNGAQGEMSIISTKPSNPKLFGSRFNRSPLIGPQYLQDNFANLRSVCGVIRTNDTCSKVTIKKITKKKKNLPKLCSVKCPLVEACPSDMKKVPLVPLKKKYDPKDPIRCENIVKEICKRSDDNWKLKPKPFGKISDCPRVQVAVEMKECAPISRLPKIDMLEPPKDCKPPGSLCAPRSDENLTTCERKLPQIPCGNFCIPLVKVEPGEPIRRLKKCFVPEPPKICPPKPKCERADDNIEVAEKCLPILTLKCPPPPVEDKLMDCKKIKRLIPRKVEEKPRACVKPVELCDDPFRSDDCQLAKEKKLPKYESSKCKLVCVPPQLKEGCILQRPQKLYDPKDPMRKCIIPSKCKLESVPVKPKILPKVLFSGQATFPQLILKEGNPIKRMDKKKYPDPERICPVKDICDESGRADAKLTVKKSCLPRLQSLCAPVVKYNPETKQIPIKRLPKITIEEPKKICPTVEKCQRADVNSTVKKKCLPVIEDNDCPPELYVEKLKDMPALKRLTPKEICPTERCKPQTLEKCIRSDMDDWDYIIERSCYPVTDKCRPKRVGHVSTKRSMSTNLSSQLNKGLLIRRAQLSHIDLRKRFSNGSCFLHTEKNKNKFVRAAEIHSSCVNRCDKDARLQKELQPNNTICNKFKALDPIKPEAPLVDATIEDECVREKLKIPFEGLTATCDNPKLNRTFFRAHQLKPKTGPDSSSCTEEIVKACSSSCNEVVNSCSSNTSCPPTFSPKFPCPPPCPPIITRPKSCPKFKNPCGKKASLWQRIVNYFKARPNCPPPGAYKQKKLMKKAKQMADRAGLGIYDPCDDPRLICKEVEKRCCLAKKTSCGIGKRCLHSSGAMNNIYSMAPSVGILPFNERVMRRIHILNRRIVHQNSDSCRNMSSWRNPYEFYNFNKDFEGEKLVKYSTTSQEKYCDLNSEAVYLYESYGGIDIDSIKENMLRILFVASSISPNLNDEEFEVDNTQVQEYGAESMECRRELLMEMLHKILQNLETISKKNFINFDEKDSTQKTIRALGKILDTTRHKR